MEGGEGAGGGCFAGLISAWADEFSAGWASEKCHVDEGHPLHEEVDNVTAPTAPVAGRREWIGLAVLALACLLYVMDLTVLHLAVPAISADLRPSSVQLL